VLFQSITHMAPAAAVVFALVACLFVASSIGQLAKHLPSAGGFATYTSRGLHPGVGFMVAWLYSLAEPDGCFPPHNGTTALDDRRRRRPGALRHPAGLGHELSGTAAGSIGH
jgi:hypothetical protein